MASSGNFPVFNVLYRGQIGTSSNNYGNITEGNTNLKSSSSSDALQITTFEGLKSGKWYWEWILVSPGGDRLMHAGAADSNRANWDYTSSNAVYGSEKSIHFHTYNQIMEKDGSDTGAYSSSSSSHSNGDVFGFALDVDNGKAYIHKNGTYYASGNPASGSNPGATWTPASEYTEGFTPYFAAAGGTDANGVLNFGQNSTFAGRISAGGNSDGNGFGDFKYSPPTGFLAVCSANLPISADIDPAQTDDNIPQKQFGVVAYTGNGGTQDITGLGFKPDLVWYARRDSSSQKVLMDSSRGTSAALESSTDGTEDTSFTQGITAFGTDGFSLGNQSQGNASSGTYVAWCWRANGGTTASNSDGSITSTVQANTKSGFSICTYAGNSTNGATFGHGLSAKPDFSITKVRNKSGESWIIYHSSMGYNKFGRFSNAAFETNNTTRFSQEPTSSLVYLGTDPSTNTGYNYVSYIWHNVEGMQNFGTYTGNANDDGPFIYTGFRPRMVFVKQTEQTGTEWSTNDSARNTFNPTEKQTNWENGNTEVTGKNIDFLSNGFKIRKNTGAMNNSGRVHIYGAWADVPFKYNNTF